MVVFLVPLIVVLLTLGVAYAASVARGIQQEFASEQLGDLGHFVNSSQRAFASGNLTLIRGEIDRHGELYGTRVLVFDRGGEVWAANTDAPVHANETIEDLVGLALAGNRGDAPQPMLPWSSEDALLVQPVFEDRDVIGAVVLVSDTAGPRSAILGQWALLALVSALAIAAGALLVNRIATWVLQPLRRVSSAMESIEQGDMEARIDDGTGPPELQRMILVFNQMAHEVERVVSRQQEFVLNASHELRNPLNALLLRVEFLATGLDDDWEGDVEETREEGRRMTRILDTLLALATSDGDEIEMARTDVGDLVRDRARAWRPAADAKGISFDLSGVGTVLCATDRTVLESALDTIIDNAVKYSGPGSRVDLSTANTSSGCRISVRDHGPGLPAEELVHATGRFWRSQASLGIPGSGLGLAIASDLMASIGGEVRLANPAGGGLRVSLEIIEEGAS